MKVTNLAQYRREKERRERRRRRQAEALRKAHRGRPPAVPFGGPAVGQGGVRDSRRARRLVEGSAWRDALPYLGALFLLSLLLAFALR